MVEGLTLLSLSRPKSCLRYPVSKLAHYLTMAEVIGVLSLAAAIPAVAVAVAQICKYLLTQLKAVNDANEDTEEFRQLASDLYNGQMKIYWEIAGDAYRSEKSEAAIKQSLEDC